MTMISLSRTQIIPKENTTKVLFFVGLASVVLGIIFLGIFWTKLPPQVPLYFSKPWGEGQLAKPIFLTLPIFLSIIFLLINTLLSQLSENYPFLKKVLITGATLACVLATIFVVRTILLII